MSAPVVIYDASKIDFEKPGKHHYHIAFHHDSTWGYSLVPLTVINGLKKSHVKSPGLVVFGGTHGNEWEGQVAVKRLCRDLDPIEISGRVILMPQLSESACVANTRISPLDGVNMNRAFPGNPRGSISYRIAHFVKTRIFPQARVVIDVHSGGNEGGFALCTSFHSIADPEQRAEMNKVAALFDTPFILLYSSGMASGLLPEEAEKEGKIAIGGEFGFGESVNIRGVRHAYEGVKNVLRHYGMLPGDIVKIDPGRQSPPRMVDASNLEDYIPAPRTGIWEPVVELGADVRAGELLGRLHDFSDHSSESVEIVAQRAGALLMMHFPAHIAKGVTLFVIAQEINL
jgi:N2-acetyl-L-2,4-diaminobutanoate deacetylase